MRERKKFKPRPPRVKKERWSILVSNYNQAIEEANIHMSEGRRTWIEGGAFGHSCYFVHFWD